MTTQLIIRKLGTVDYQTTWEQMRDFTQSRTADTPDEIWLLEHPPVFTQGQAGKPEHILDAADIPIVQTDRGGQVTYHGPGQLVCYVLFDLTRLNIGTRVLVNKLEQTVIQLLAHYNIEAQSRSDAPGIYVKDAKICSIGLRVKRSCSYHGIAFNIKMDLSPFLRINPCGYQGMQMIQLSQLVPNITITEVEDKIIEYVSKNFGYRYNAQQIVYI